MPVMGREPLPFSVDVFDIVELLRVQDRAFPNPALVHLPIRADDLLDEVMFDLVARLEACEIGGALDLVLFGLRGRERQQDGGAAVLDGIATGSSLSFRS